MELEEEILRTNLGYVEVTFGLEPSIPFLFNGDSCVFSNASLSLYFLGRSSIFCFRRNFDGVVFSVFGTDVYSSGRKLHIN